MMTRPPQHPGSPEFILFQLLPPSVLFTTSVDVVIYSVFVLLGSMTRPRSAPPLDNPDATTPQFAPPFVLLKTARLCPGRYPAAYTVLGLRGSIDSPPIADPFGIPRLAVCQVVPASML